MLKNFCYNFARTELEIEASITSLLCAIILWVNNQHRLFAEIQHILMLLKVDWLLKDVRRMHSKSIRRSEAFEKAYVQ